MIGGEGGIPQSFFLSLFAFIRQTNLPPHIPALSGQTKFIPLTSHNLSSEAFLNSVTLVKELAKEELTSHFSSLPLLRPP